MNTPAMTDEEHSVFLRGFDLAQPPGPDDANALKVAEEVIPSKAGQLCVAVSKPLAKKFLAELDRPAQAPGRRDMGGIPTRPDRQGRRRAGSCSRRRTGLTLQ